MTEKKSSKQVLIFELVITDIFYNNIVVHAVSLQRYNVNQVKCGIKPTAENNMEAAVEFWIGNDIDISWNTVVGHPFNSSRANAS